MPVRLDKPLRRMSAVKMATAQVGRLIGAIAPENEPWFCVRTQAMPVETTGMN
jgi:hypothetical protein